jgi:hypothetical protein
MAHRVRILSPSEQVPSTARIWAALSEANLAGRLTVASGTDANRTQIVLAHESGPEIADIERDCRSSSALVTSELEELLEDIADRRPARAAVWLAEYLPRVKTIYAFQLLCGTDVKNGWEILGKVEESIFTQVGGILQADGEGFSNEEGYHILWQFSNS